MNPQGGARHFHLELGELKSLLLEMSTFAEDLVRHAVDSLREGDTSKAEAVVLGDRELNAMELEVEDRCIHLLALQQPLARDLRLIAMALKVSNDLERVGDHAVNIAQAVQHLAELPPFPQLPEIEEMARLARGMLSDSLDGFVRGDAVAARLVCALDDRLDELHHSMFGILVAQMMEDSSRIGGAMEIFLVSRNLERIGDLATNIAEDAVFLVEGHSIRHGRGEVD
jgi:phosphate transport system protein